MKTIIKVLCVLMCLLMALSVLSACKKKDEPDNPPDSQTDPVGPSNPIDNPDQPDNPGTDSDLIDDQMRAKYPGMDVIGISYPEDLTVLMDIVNASANVRALTENTVYYLASDLVFNDGWSPVAAVRNGQVITPNQPGDVFEGFIEFYGIFDGNGHTISGLYINDDEMISYDSLGFFGDLYGTVKDLTLENCFVGASIEEDQTLTDTAIGVLAGRLMGSGKQIENINLISSNVVFQGNVSPNLGGVIGAVEGDNNVLSNIAYSGRVILAAADGSYPSPAKEVVMAQLVGNANDNTIKMENCVAGGSLIGIEIEDDEENFSCANSADVTCIDCRIEEYAGGEALSDAIEIYIPKDLLTLDPTKDYAGKTIRLMNDINFNPGWTPSGASSGSMEVPSVFWSGLPRFAGTFDGNGHTISGICRLVDLDRTSYVGGFVEVLGSKAVIKNLTIENSALFAYTTSKNKLSGIRLGGLIARAELGGRIENVTVNMDVWAVGNVSAAIDGIQAFEGISSTLTKENVYFYGATGNLELSAISGLFSELDPYIPDGYDEEIIEVYNAADLMAVMNRAQNGEDFESMTVRLMNDIDLNPGVDLRAKLDNKTNSISFPDKSKIVNEWLGIPTFKGVFDGNGYAISGLYSWRNAISKNNGSYGGFIDVASSGAIIKNLIIRNSIHVVNNTGDGAWGSRSLYTGGLVAKNDKPRGSKTTFSLTVSNVYVDMDVVLLCSNHGTVGGILAFSVRHENETDESGKALSNYTSPYRLSNVVFAGRIVNTDYTLKVPFTSPKDQFSMSQLVSDTNWGSEHQISNVLVAGQIITGNVDGEGVSDIFGANTYNGVNASNIVVGRYATTPKTAYNLKNKVETDTFNSSSWVYDVYLGYYVPQSISTMILANGIGDVMSVDSAERETFVPAKSDPYKIHISTADELIALAQSGKDFIGTTIYLDADIDFNPGWLAKTDIVDGKVVFPTEPAVTWTAFKTFKGILDGQGHTISGLYSKRTVTGNAGNYGGLIDTQSDGVVKNLAIVNSIHIVENKSGSAPGVHDLRVGGLAARIAKTQIKSADAGKDKYALGNSDHRGFNLNNFFTDMEVWLVSRTNALVGGIVGQVDTNYRIAGVVFAGKVGSTNSLSGGSANYSLASGAANLAMGQVIGRNSWLSGIDGSKNAYIDDALVVGTIITGTENSYIHTYVGSDDKVGYSRRTTELSATLPDGVDEEDGWVLTTGGFYAYGGVAKFAEGYVIGLNWKGQNVLVLETAVPEFIDSEAGLSVIIPEGVTAIEDSAFAPYKDELISITFPSTLRAIGASAFAGCTKLKSISLPNNLALIGTSAFADCTFTTMNLPDSVSSIGTSAFAGCPITTLKLPASLTVISESAFAGMADLTSITLPSALTEIGESAFKGCTVLATVSGMENTQLTTIGTWAFQNCTALGAIAFPNTLTTIGNYAFDGCTNLELTILPENVNTIGMYAFKGCSKLTDITFECVDKVITINSGAFDSIKTLRGGLNMLQGSGLPSEMKFKLQHLVFISGEVLGKNLIKDFPELISIDLGPITSIKAGSFNNCPKLTTVTIPADAEVQEGTFINMTGITAYAVEAGNETVKAIDDNLYTADGTKLLAYAAAKTATTYTIPAGLSAIGAYAFSGCTALTSMTYTGTVAAFEASVKAGDITVDEHAFDQPIPFHCTDGYTCAIHTVVVDEAAVDAKCTEAGSTEASHCSVCGKILSTKQTIDALGHAYGDDDICTRCGKKKPSESLIFVSNGDGTCYATVVGTYEGTSVVIPAQSPAEDTVTGIGDNAFKGLAEITSITLPETLTSIGNYAFAGTAITGSITLPANLVSIGDYAFKDTAITGISIPATVTSIGEGAFANCASLVINASTVAAGNTKYKSVGSTTAGIYECNINGTLIKLVRLSTDRLTYTLSKDIKEIDPYAFSCCTKLTNNISVNSNNKRYKAYNGVLYDLADESSPTLVRAKNAASITIGSTSLANPVVHIAPGAFSGCDKLKEITLIATIEDIGDEAFLNCTQLAKVTNEATNLKHVGTDAFKGCTALTSAAPTGSED